MNSGKKFFFVFMLTLWGHLLCEEGPFESCTRYTSFGFGYRDFFELQNVNFPPNQMFYLEFYVKTNSDAHILLKPDIQVDQGYEIVIGGGSNTFSQIRLLQVETRKTMITQKTENFLSGIEYKYFWISMDKLGIISVGKKENDEVFINWRFDEPFPVKYFSFGSWTNMKADWRFGCTAQKDSGIKHEEGVMTPESKLKRDLFTLYDPNALPADKTLEVKVNFQINTVQLDEKRGVLTMHGIGDLTWLDRKIKWKPENYNGIESLYVPPFQIWTPNIRVLNSLALDKSPLFDLTTAGVMAKYDGSIFWRPPFKSVSQCVIDLEYWPVDVHNCSVLFGFWLEPWNLVLTMMNQYDILSKEKTESGWQIAELAPFNTNHPDDDSNYGVLYIKLKRANEPLIIITTPYLAALIVTLTSFWLPLQSPLKLHLACGSVIVLLLTLFLTGQLIPAMTKSTPKIINVYSWTTVISCLPIVLFIVLRNILTHIRVPDVLSRILGNKLFSSVLFLPDLDKMTMEYSNFNHEVNKLNKNRLNAIRLVTVIERIFFLLYILAIYFLL